MEQNNGRRFLGLLSAKWGMHSPPRNLRSLPRRAWSGARQAGTFRRISADPFETYEAAHRYAIRTRTEQTWTNGDCGHCKPGAPRRPADRCLPRLCLNRRSFMPHRRRSPRELVSARQRASRCVPGNRQRARAAVLAAGYNSSRGLAMTNTDTT